MLMEPGLVPHDQIAFLDSLPDHSSHPQQPVIFVNHYPLDESLSNWYAIVDWPDLDGNLLISNVIFAAMKVVDGKVMLCELPGIGIIKKG